MRGRSKERGRQAQIRLEDDSQRLRRLRREALEAAEGAYVYGDANSYSYDAMRRAMALDRELSKFHLVPKRQCEAEN
jgi:hypothetical protein